MLQVAGCSRPAARRAPSEYRFAIVDRIEVGRWPVSKDVVVPSDLLRSPAFMDLSEAEHLRSRSGDGG